MFCFFSKGYIIASTTLKRSDLGNRQMSRPIEKEADILEVGRLRTQF